MVTTLVYGRWQPPGVTSLPDLEGCSEDMWACRQMLLRLRDELASRETEFVLMDALATAALVRYARSFTKGLRRPFRWHEHTSLSQEDIALHHRAILIRNKHVAHPINRFETHAVQVVFHEDLGADAKVTVVSSSTLTNLALSPHDAVVLLSLCEKWLAWLERAMDAERSRLLPLAQQISGIDRMELPRGPAPTSADADKARSVGKSVKGKTNGSGF